ncbi:MAG: hypothetical protein WDW36_009084 [Sanguina aurantia]
MSGTPASGGSPAPRCLGQSLQSLTTPPAAARRSHTYGSLSPASHPASAGSSRPPTPPSRTTTPNMLSSGAAHSQTPSSILAAAALHGADPFQDRSPRLSQSAGSSSGWHASPLAASKRRESAAQVLNLPGSSMQLRYQSGSSDQMTVPRIQRGASGTGSKSSIQVSVRMRPLGERELARGDHQAWGVDAQCNVGSFDRNGLLQVKHRYDTVFGPDSCNSEVFETVGRPFISPALDGLNGTIFAYGVTSSGKTHTMMGGPNEPGLVPRIIRDTFAHAAAITSAASPHNGGSAAPGPGRGSAAGTGCSGAFGAGCSSGGASGRTGCSTGDAVCYSFRLSMMEVYNEVLNDLLEPANLNLQLREGAGRGVVVEGLREEVVHTAEQALALVERGDAYRKWKPTENFSSTVGLMYVRDNLDNLNQSMYPWATNSPAGITSLTEGPNGIITSGTQAGTACLNNLNCTSTAHTYTDNNARISTITTKGIDWQGEYKGDGWRLNGQESSAAEHTGGAANSQHVPYRDSKLTRLLQNSLSGSGARIAIICNVTPAAAQSDETANTLKFATRAKLVRVSVHRNELLDDKALIRRYQRELTDLRKELALLNAASGLSPRGLPGMRAGSGAGGGGGSGGEAGGGDTAPLRDTLSVERQLRGRLERDLQVLRQSVSLGPGRVPILPSDVSPRRSVSSVGLATSPEHKQGAGGLTDDIIGTEPRSKAAAPEWSQWAELIPPSGHRSLIIQSAFEDNGEGLDLRSVDEHIQDLQDELGLEGGSASTTPNTAVPEYAISPHPDEFGSRRRSRDAPSSSHQGSGTAGSDSLGGDSARDTDKDLEIQVLLADREVLQDQVVVVELQNEELKEAVGLLQAEAGATQLLLASCMRRVEEVRDVHTADVQAVVVSSKPLSHKRPPLVSSAARTTPPN